MTRKTRIYVFIIMLLLLASAGTVGYYLYNKGPREVKDSSALQVSAAALYEAYNKDTLAARQYTDKVLSVTGQVNEIAVNQQQKKILILKTNSADAFINCTMEENIQNIKAGDKVNLKGICSGMGSADPDLGIKGDVYLTRCYLIK